MQRRNVDLPEPDGPSRHITSRAATWSVIPFRTSLRPKRLCTPSAFTIGAALTGYAQLVLTCQGALYLARRIDLGARSDTLSLDGGAESDTQALAIELQRSLNYYESHYDRAQIADVFVASGDARAQQLLERLRR